MFIVWLLSIAVCYVFINVINFLSIYFNFSELSASLTILQLLPLEIDGIFFIFFSLSILRKSCADTCFFLHWFKGLRACEHVITLNSFEIVIIPTCHDSHWNSHQIKWEPEHVDSSGQLKLFFDSSKCINLATLSKLVLYFFIKFRVPIEGIKRDG